MATSFVCESSGRCKDKIAALSKFLRIYPPLGSAIHYFGRQMLGLAFARYVGDALMVRSLEGVSSLIKYIDKPSICHVQVVEIVITGQYIVFERIGMQIDRKVIELKAQLEKLVLIPLLIIYKSFLNNS